MRSLLVFAALTGAAHAQQMTLTEEGNSVVAGTIRALGYRCPGTEQVFAEGVDAYGKVYKIWCGEGDASGKPIYFRLTMRGQGVVPLVAPWKD